MPFGDWQFWVVSILALGAAAFVARALLPPRLLPPFLRRRRGTRAPLTVGGKAPRRRKPRRNA